MELPTILTNLPTVQLRKARLWKTLLKIGEILRMVLVILVLAGFMVLYILLSLVTPAGG